MIGVEDKKEFEPLIQNAEFISQVNGLLKSEMEEFEEILQQGGENKEAVVDFLQRCKIQCGNEGVPELLEVFRGIKLVKDGNLSLEQSTSLFQYIKKNDFDSSKFATVLDGYGVGCSPEDVQLFFEVFRGLQQDKERLSNLVKNMTPDQIQRLLSHVRMHGFKSEMFKGVLDQNNIHCPEGKEVEFFMKFNNRYRDTHLIRGLGIALRNRLLGLLQWD